jgi:hypothetical protein
VPRLEPVRCTVERPDLTSYLALVRRIWLNELEGEQHVMAEQLGRKDGGGLVIQLCGHPNRQRAYEHIRAGVRRRSIGRPTPSG